MTRETTAAGRRRLLVAHAAKGYFERLRRLRFNWTFQHVLEETQRLGQPEEEPRGVVSGYIERWLREDDLKAA